MGIDNLVKIAIAVVMAAALTGQLPKLTMAVRHAQIQLLKESRASNWGSPDFLRPNKALKTSTK